MSSSLNQTMRSLLMALLLMFFGYSLTQAQGPKVTWQVIASGGALNIASGKYLISATIGQPIIGNISFGGFRHFIGFWGPQAIKQEITGINEITAKGENSLLSNYPNPFSLQTTISYQVPQSSAITIRIVDMVGRELRTLMTSEYRESGSHTIVWDGKNNVGSDLESGNFICEMTLMNRGETLKSRIPLMLVK